VLLKHLDKIISVSIGIAVFTLYYLTKTPAISGHDSSELAAVQATLGIAHPTGYPLFTIVGYLFNKIPISSNPFLTLNILNLIWGVLAIIVFYFLQVLILKNVFKEGTVRSDSWIYVIIAVFGSFLLAFSFAFWSESLSVEVYTLHFFLLMLIIWSGVKSYFSPNPVTLSKRSIFTKWLPVAVFVGLGFSNHLTTLYIVPALLFLFIKKYRFTKKSVAAGIFLILIALVIISINYSYIIIRAAQNPDLNWGNPSDLGGFIYHVSGGLYQEHFMAGIAEFKKQGLHFLETLFNPEYWQFNVGIILSLIGVELLIRKERVILSFLTIAFITNLAFALNYRIPDINAYFMLSYIAIVVFIGIGLVGIYQFIKNRFLQVFIISAICSGILVYQIVPNYFKLDYSDNYMFLDYTKVVLNSVEPNAVIICSPKTPFVFPAWYLQSVENFRKDVAIISVTLNQRWYLQQIGKYNHDLIDLEKNQFLLNFSKRPTYIYSELVPEFQIPDGFIAVPDQYLFKAVDSAGYYETRPPKVDVRFTKNDYNPFLLYIKYNIAVMLENRLKYEEKFGKIDIAKKYSDLLREKFPYFPYKSEYYYP